jgi:hypothetical protein
MDIIYRAKLRLQQQIAIRAESDAHLLHKIIAMRASGVQEHTCKKFKSQGNFGEMVQN